jgi:hypothetical protein
MIKELVRECGASNQATNGQKVREQDITAEELLRARSMRRETMTATLLIAGAAWLVLSILFVAAIGLAAKKPQPTE